MALHIEPPIGPGVKDLILGMHVAPMHRGREFFERVVDRFVP
jgi:hypothetical protein